MLHERINQQFLGRCFETFHVFGWSDFEVSFTSDTKNNNNDNIILNMLKDTFDCKIQ